MERLPRATAAQLLRVLGRAGWFIHHQSGSHAILKHPERSGRVIVARHAGIIIKPKVMRSILESAGLTPEDFRRLS